MLEPHPTRTTPVKGLCGAVSEAEMLKNIIIITTQKNRAMSQNIQSIIGVETDALVSVILLPAALVSMVVYALYVAGSTMKLISRWPIDGDDGMHWN